MAESIERPSKQGQRDAEDWEKSAGWTHVKHLTPELSRPVAGRRTRASVAHSTRLTPRHGVGLDESLCDHAQPGEARMSLSFVGADNREPGITAWSEDGWRPVPATEAQSAAHPERGLSGANGLIKRDPSGANNSPERCLAGRRAARAECSPMRAVLGCGAA